MYVHEYNFCSVLFWGADYEQTNIQKWFVNIDTVHENKMMKERKKQREEEQKIDIV